MRIITINVPQVFLDAIDTLTGQKGLYPSRSELIRVAVRDWLLKEIQASKEFEKYVEPPQAIIPTDPNKISFEDGTTFTLKPRVVSP